MAKPILPVLVNRGGGAASKTGDRLPELLSHAFAAAGSEADIRMLTAPQLAQAIERAAQEHARIVVAGGDGTIAAAAQMLVGTDTELSILPLGTLNHFAQDLGISADLSDSARLAVAGQARSIDVGEVNGRTFINNASIGLYSFMVRNREDIRARHGWPKWLAMLPASWAALAQLHHHRLHIDVGLGEDTVITPLLCVGNNRYSLEGGAIGCRDSLSDGKLSIYAVSPASRLGLLWCGVRALLGLVDPMRDFQTLGETQALTVRSSARAIEIALDGEVQWLELPLAFRTRAGSLKVVAP